MGMCTKEAKVIIHDLLNILAGCVAEVAIVNTEPITTKVKGDRVSAFELELMLSGEGLDDGGRILAGNQEIIDIHSYVLVVIPMATHPNIAFGLGGNQSHISQYAGQTFMPT